jgi:hypothetical protein
LRTHGEEDLGHSITRDSGRVLDESHTLGIARTVFEHEHAANDIDMQDT